MSESLVPEVFEGEVQLDTRDAGATREDAFRVYVTTGARSIRKTAHLIGRPEGTVLSWSQRDNWRLRVRDMDLEVTEGIAEAAAAAAVAQQLQNITYLSQVRDDSEQETKDRLKATSLLMDEFRDISAAIADRASKRADLEEMGESELEELAQSPEGVAQLLARHRTRVGLG